MSARISSSPVQTVLVAVEIEVSCDLSWRTTSSCSRIADERGSDRRRIHGHLALGEGGQREQPRQPDGRLERRGLRRVGIDDAVDVAADDR